MIELLSKVCISPISSVGRAHDFKSCGGGFDPHIGCEYRKDVNIQRPWCSGNITAFQAVAVGSIPAGRILILISTFNMSKLLSGNFTSY